MITLMRLLAGLPLSWLYVLAKGLAWFARVALRYRKRVIIENLSRSFPDKSPTEIQNLARQFYDHLSQVVVESLKGQRLSQEEIIKRAKFLNPEVLSQKIAAGESALVLTSHFCNWEWILLGFSAQVNVPILAVYQPLSSAKADQVMLKMRSRFGAKLVGDHLVMRELIATRSQPKVIAIVADQTPRPKDKQLVFDFLNQKTPFFSGPQKIAQYLNCSVFYADMRKLRLGYYQIKLVEIGTAPYQNPDSIIENFATKLQESINEQPAYWLWSHKRWKYAQAE
jgi:KDO2-lipid IV(A) lauroyltransferase